MGAFIAKMLLPTISSLVLLPTASLAAKRGFHMEAMVYFFTMFFMAVRIPDLILSIDLIVTERFLDFAWNVPGPGFFLSSSVLM